MKFQTVRTGMAMAAILTVTGVTGFAGASPASARSYDGAYPVGSICKDRKMVEQLTIYSRTQSRVNLGKVQLWKSRTCHTAWARIESLKVATRSSKPEATVWRNRDNNVVVCVVPVGAKVCNTRMQDDYKTTSFAVGSIRYAGINNGAIGYPH